MLQKDWIWSRSVVYSCEEATGETIQKGFVRYKVILWLWELNGRDQLLECFCCSADLFASFIFVVPDPVKTIKHMSWKICMIWMSLLFLTVPLTAILKEAIMCGMPLSPNFASFLLLLVCVALYILAFEKINTRAYDGNNVKKLLF